MAEVKIGFIEKIWNKAIYNSYNANNALHDMVSEIPAKFKAKGNSSNSTASTKSESNKKQEQPKSESSKKQEQPKPTMQESEKKEQQDENIVIENDFVCNGPDFSKFAEDDAIDVEVISEEDLHEVTEEDLAEALRKDKENKK